MFVYEREREKGRDMPQLTNGSHRMPRRQKWKRARVYDSQILHADDSSFRIHNGVGVVGGAHGAGGSCVVDGGH